MKEFEGWGKRRREEEEEEEDEEEEPFGKWHEDDEDGKR